MSKTLPELISDLPKNYQLILSLYYCEKLTFAEMSLVLDITPQQACNLYCRAYTKVIAERLKVSQLSNT